MMFLGWAYLIASPFIVYMAWTSNDIEYLRFMAVVWALMIGAQGLGALVGKPIH